MCASELATLEIAGVRFLACMRALVHIQMATLRASKFAALKVAGVRFLASVRALVRYQAIRS